MGNRRTILSFIIVIIAICIGFFIVEHKAIAPVDNSNILYTPQINPENSITKSSVPTTPIAPRKDAPKCFVGGCSNQICSDQTDIITNCEYQPQYACYKTASCARQSDGNCGWTQTSELQSCLKANQ